MITPTAPEKGRPRGFDRDQALETAMLLFWRNGYEGTSIAQLTSAIGIAAPSLYAAFGSKDALYRESLHLYVRSLGDLGVARLAEAPSIRAGIHAVLSTAAEAFTRSDAPPGCMVGVGSLRVARETQLAAEAAASLRGDSHALLLDRLNQARVSGELPAFADPQALADFYAAVLEGMSVAAIDGADRDRLVALGDLAMTAWPEG